MRGLRDRLVDILEAIEGIEAKRSKEKATFDSDPLLQVRMVHHLLIIGEAVRSIDPAIKRNYPSVPWRQIAGMRNVLVHDYFRINPEIVWTTVENDIPRLKERFQEILRQILPPPKLCAICKVHYPTAHLTQNVKGKILGKIMIRKIDLCENCARQNGIGDQNSAPLPESVWSLAAPEFVDDPEES